MKRSFFPILAALLLAVFAGGCMQDYQEQPMPAGALDASSLGAVPLEDGLMTERGGLPCDMAGVVRVGRREDACAVHIVLRGGGVIVPVNLEAVPREIRDGQRVRLSFRLVRNAEPVCDRGRPVRITCLTLIDREIME